MEPRNLRRLRLAAERDTRRAQRAQKQAEADAVIAPVLESFKKLIAQQRTKGADHG